MALVALALTVALFLAAVTVFGWLGPTDPCGRFGKQDPITNECDRVGD